METSSPRNARTVVVGGGTMGADVAVVLARGGTHVTVVDPHTERRNRLLPHITQELAAAGQAAHAGPVQVCASLQEVGWTGVVLVVDSVPPAARRGAASAGTVLVATIRPPRAARNKTFFIMGSTFLNESRVYVARNALALPMQIAT